MKHGTYHIFVLSALVFASVCGAGCHSVRTAAEKTETERTTVLHRNERSDSFKIHSSATATEEDSVEVRTAESADIRISRDSSGRINRIVYRGNRQCVQSGWAQQSQSTEALQSGGSYRATASDSIYSVVQTAAEAKKEVGTPISVTEMVGVSLVLMVLLHLVYVILTDNILPWMRKRKNKQ